MLALLLLLLAFQDAPDNTCPDLTYEVTVPHVVSLRAGKLPVHAKITNQRTVPIALAVAELPGSYSLLGAMRKVGDHEEGKAFGPTIKSALFVCADSVDPKTAQVIPGKCFQPDAVLVVIPPHATYEFDGAAELPPDLPPGKYSGWFTYSYPANQNDLARGALACDLHSNEVPLLVRKHPPKH